MSTFVNKVFSFFTFFFIIYLLSDQQRYNDIDKKLNSFMKILVSFINSFDNKCSFFGFFMHVNLIFLIWTDAKLYETNQFLFFDQGTNIKSMLCPL